MNGRRPSLRARPLRVRTWAKYVIVLVLLLIPGLVNATGKKPKKTDGPYTISVGGSYTGRGHAVVAEQLLTISAEVTDGSGAEGLLVGVDLKIDGSHFKGTGLVCGRPATFTGRLDGYSEDKHFRGARILCSFRETNGSRGGRVAGVLRPLLDPGAK